MVKRVFFFLSLVLLCVAVSSINLSRITGLKYAELQRLEQTGDSARAKAGFRVLAAGYPCTVAGIKSIRRLASYGEPLPGLVLGIVEAEIKNTTAAEWLVLFSAFSVVTVFMTGNSLPPAILLLFVISCAGMVHRSHPLLSINNDAFDAMLAVNPYLYSVLTLLTAGGYLHQRWKAPRLASSPGAPAGNNLTPGEHLLMRKIYLQKLATLRERAKRVEGELRTPYGRHFVRELGRIYDKILTERQTIERELVSAAAKHQATIQSAEKIIDRARQELKESKILLRGKALDRKAYERIRLEKKSTLRQSRQRISEVKALEREEKTVRLRKRLGFMRRDLFLAHLHEAFIDRQETAMKVVQDQGLFHPNIARNDLRERKIVHRKCAHVDGKLDKLEERRGKLTGLAYREKLHSLKKEKTVKDSALVEVADRISRRMELCKNMQGRLESAIQVLTEELADMKTLGRIRCFFPALVRVQRGRIRQAIKSGRETLPALQKIEKIYCQAMTTPTA